MNPNWCSQSSKNQLISDFLKLLHQTESQTLLHLFQACEKHLVPLSETQFSYLQDEANIWNCLIEGSSYHDMRIM